MEIKIVGSDCKNGMQLYKIAQRASEKVFPNIEIREVNDSKAINEYGVKNVPGLVINNKLVSQGKVLKEKEICKLMQ